MNKRAFSKPLSDTRTCTHCATHLPAGPRPVVKEKQTARIMIIGQAPGTKVHASGVPWSDASGNRLRDRLDLDKDIFYDEGKFTIVPMGFCGPGTNSKGGDFPPHPSWYTGIGQKKNPWFEEGVIPDLRRGVHDLLAKG